MTDDPQRAIHTWRLVVILVCSPGIGAVAQLGEHLVCNQKVVGSSPIGSSVCPVIGVRSISTHPKDVRGGKHSSASFFGERSMYHVTMAVFLTSLCGLSALAGAITADTHTATATQTTIVSSGEVLRMIANGDTDYSWTPAEDRPTQMAQAVSTNHGVAAIGCGAACDACWLGTSFELDCDPTWQDDGFCDCGCQFPDTLDCGLPACAPPCQVCHAGTINENNCPLEWEGDGECDCGCQFPDTLDCLGSPCGTECQFCHFGTVNENNCPFSWAGDNECDCGCQFSDAGDCGIGGSGPDLIMLDDVVFPVIHTNPAYSLGIDSTVLNQGTVQANAAFDMTWYISVDPDLSPTLDLVWAFVTLDCCLPPGSPIRVSGAVAWPDVAPFNTPGQTYYVGVMADDTFQVAESNEQNNWGTAIWSLTLCDHTGDLSGDFWTNLADYSRLSACLQGPDVAKPDLCLCADNDNDTDVDLRDVASFLAAFDTPQRGS